MRINISQAAEFLRERDDFLILMHASPDGDTLGSGFALCRALLQTGKRARAVCPDEIPHRFDYLSEGITYPEFEPKTIVCVDVADPRLLGDMKETGQRAELCIDHHVSNTDYAERLLLAPDYAAAAELMYQLLTYMSEVKITPEIASCLYTGIATDTGCFRFSNTSPQTHIFAAELMRFGADIAPINYTMFDMRTKGRIRLEQEVMSGLRYYGGGRIAVIDVPKALISSIPDIDNDDVGALANLPRQIEGVDIGVCIKEKKPGVLKASLRTSENADAAAIAEVFDGGGHERAAGCSFIGVPLAEAEKTLVAECLKVLGL